MGPYPTEELVWHYTDRAGFEGIVSSHTVWATATDSMNDTGEGQFGVRDLQDYWAALRPALIPDAPADEMDAWISSALDRLQALGTYVVCGCNTVDSLVHWRSYIGEDRSAGYAIGFRPEAEFHVLTSNGDDRMYLPDFVPAMFWREVTYGSHLDWEHRSNYWDRYKQLVDAALTSLDHLRKGKVSDAEGLRRVMDRDLFTAVLTSKHEAYRSEEESRVLVIGSPGEASQRTGRYGPQKFVTLTGDAGHGWEFCSTPAVVKLPIAKVMIGPWNDAGGIPRAAEFLADNGYDVAVERSQIPIR